MDLQAIDVNNLDRIRLQKMLQELQFTSLMRRLPENMRVGAEVTELNDSDAKLPSIEVRENLPDSLDNPVVVAFENGQIILSDNPARAYQTTLTKAAELLSGHQVVVHDLKSLARLFLDRNLPVNFLAEYDTKHASFLLNSLKPILNLRDYAISLGVASPGLVDLLSATYVLWQQTSEELAGESELEQLAKTVDFPLQLVLAKMEHRGVAVDASILSSMSTKLANEIGLLEQAIWQTVGYEFNVSSPKQLSDALFAKLQLPPTAKKNKSGNYPTGAKELAKLAGQHPVINMISEYRELTKLKSTYVDALPRAVAPDGRIHTTLDQDVTATGRLSSSNPNLQNIPTRSDRGKEIKRAFIAPTGRVIINADYAQFELRLAAALAGDRNMIEMFENPDNDIHTMTAAEAYGIAPDQVTPEQRRHAKVINFGVLYGMSPHGLAEATGMDLSSASAFIRRYFAIRKPIRDFIDNTLELAEKRGYVETLFGRRRPTPDVKSANFMVREAAKRAAANMPIQGTEADLMKMAMLKIEQIDGASQIMQVHDSIMVECNQADAERIASEMKQVMEQIYPQLGVRLLVDIKIGRSWAEV